MMKKKLGILSAVICAVLCLPIMNGAHIVGTANASSIPTGLAINDNNYVLSWDEVTQAEHYLWSADGETWQRTDDTEVNVNGAVVRGGGTINFTVKAVTAEGESGISQPLTYTYDKYVAWTQKDLAALFADDGQEYGTMGEEASRALSVGMNDMMRVTFAFSQGSKTQFWSFAHDFNDSTEKTAWNENYAIRIIQHEGKIELGAGYSEDNWKTVSMADATSFEVGTKYTLDFGAADLISVAGDKIGERLTVILSNEEGEILGSLHRDYMYDEQSGEFNKFFPREKRGNWLYWHNGDADMRLYPQPSTALQVTIDDYSRMAAWEQVDGVSSYMYSTDGMNYSDITANKVDLHNAFESAINAANGKAAYVEIFVKAVGVDGQVLAEGSARKLMTYVFRRTQYKDLYEVMNWGPDDSLPGSASGTKLIDGFADYNNIITMGFMIEDNPQALDDSIYLALGHNNTGNVVWDKNYTIYLRPKSGDIAEIFMGNGSLATSDESIRWRYAKLPNIIELESKYIMTVGIVESFNTAGTKQFERFLLRIASLDEQGKETILHDRYYDNYDFANTMTASERGDKLFYNSNTKSFKIMPGRFERDYDVVLFNDGGDYRNIKVEYGKAYDFSDYVPTRTGYNFSGWYILEGNTKVSIAASGIWQHNFTEVIDGRYVGTINADFAAQEYAIKYNVNKGSKGDNPDSYTIEDTIELSPAVVDSGYIFLGWYTNAGFDSSSLITTITHSQNELILYAKVVQGYTITVTDFGKTYEHKVVSGNSVTLTVESVDGYRFLRWEMLDPTTQEYVELETATITPSRDMVVRTVYELDRYSVSYELYGGSHTDNPEYITISDNITFYPATKDGYFFDGWYIDSAFSQEVITVADISLSGDITLYAKFVEDTVPSKIVIVSKATVQHVPAIVLPDNSTYSIIFYEKGKEGPLIDLIGNDKYLFDEIREYVLKYDITLRTGGKITKTIEIEVVKAPVISLSGQYLSRYSESTVLDILGAVVDTGGYTVKYEIKKDGTIITAENNKITLEVGKYTITYYIEDTSVGALPVQVSFNVQEAPAVEPAPTPSKSIWPAVVIASSVVVAGGVVGLGIFLRKKKPHA